TQADTDRHLHSPTPSVYILRTAVSGEPVKNSAVPQFLALFPRDEKKKGRQTAGPSPRRSLVERSVASSDRARPAEAGVDGGLHRMVVGGEAAGRHERGGCGEPGIAEIVVLVLGLGRPVRREHVFDAGADGVAVAVVAIDDEADRRAAERHLLVVVRIGVA